MAEIIRIPSEGDTIDGQFLLGPELGRGGYGIVFEATQLGVDRKVAVKMLLPRALEHQRDVVERFAREARLASSLRHRNAVTIYAFGVYQDDTDKEGLPYIAMEYLEGQDLQAYITQVGTLPVSEVGEILTDVLHVLDEAHQKGIIHRDLKPANIYFHEPAGESRTVKVLDFGIAMAVSPEWSEENRQRLTETGLVTGTAEYMAPEQALGSQEFTPAIDVYALGCLGYQMLTGQFPFSGSNAVEIAIKHIYEPIPDLPPEVAETVVGQVIIRALHKDPSVRFGDARSMMDALKTGETGSFDMSGGTAPSRPIEPPAPLPPVEELLAREGAASAPMTVPQPSYVETPTPRSSPIKTVVIAVASVAILVSMGVIAVTASRSPEATDSTGSDATRAAVPGTLGAPPATDTVKGEVVATADAGQAMAVEADTGSASDVSAQPDTALAESPTREEPAPDAGVTAANKQPAKPGKRPAKRTAANRLDGVAATKAPAGSAKPADKEPPKADAKEPPKADAKEQPSAPKDEPKPPKEDAAPPKEEPKPPKEEPRPNKDEPSPAKVEKKDPPKDDPPKPKEKESAEVPHGF